MPKNGEWLTRSDQDIETKIKLEAIYQVGIWDIALDHIISREELLSIVQLQYVFQLVVVVDEEYSSSLGTLARFHNQSWMSVICLVFRHITL